MSSTPASAGKQLCDLPNDIYRMIADLLPVKDLKSARLVDRRFWANARLSIPRVYISPNQTNIDVFTLIARSSSSSSVKEIIWDDALLSEIGETEFISAHEAAGWRDAPLPHYRLYAQLYKEQQAIIASGADAQALRDALPLLTSLERVTVTPTTHQPSLYLDPGRSCRRHYTPMLRALPPTFELHSPLGWNYMHDKDLYKQLPWEDIKGSWHGSASSCKNWRAAIALYPSLFAT